MSPPTPNGEALPLIPPAAPPVAPSMSQISAFPVPLQDPTEQVSSLSEIPTVYHKDPSAFSLFNAPPRQSLLKEPITQLPDFIIQDIAETHGYLNPPKLTFEKEAYDLIARMVEFRVRQVIQEAEKCMRHSCRFTANPVLAVQDIKTSLHVLKLEPIYGYSRNSSYRFLSMESPNGHHSVIKREVSRMPVNTSMVTNVVTLGENSFSNTGLTSYDAKPSNTSSLKNSSQSSVVVSRFGSKVRLVELIYQDSKTPVPCEPSLSIHWLAVFGEVPLSSQNLCENFPKKFSKTYCSITPPPSDTLAPVSPPIPKSLGPELLSLPTAPQIVSKTLNEGVLVPIPKTQLVHSFDKEGLMQTSTDSLLEASMHVAMRIPHILGIEHQYFFDEVKDAVRSAIFKKGINYLRRFHKTLYILQTFPGLEQLLPFLIQFFACEISKHNEENSKTGVSALLCVIKALIRNPHIRLHHYVHQVLVPLFEIILKSDQNMLMPTYYRFHLRRDAAIVLGEFATSMRLSSGLMDNLDCFLLEVYKRYLTSPSTSLQCCYGAVQGIVALGKPAMRLVLLPALAHLLKLVSSSASLVVMETQHAVLSATLKEERKQLLLLKAFLLSEMEQLLLKCFYDVLCDWFETSNSANSMRRADAPDALLFDALLESTAAMGERYLPILSAAIRNVSLRHYEGTVTQVPYDQTPPNVHVLSSDEYKKKNDAICTYSNHAILHMDTIVQMAMRTEGIALLSFFI